MVKPVIPNRIVKMGDNKQKNANGRYSMVETPKTPVRKTPQTLHGTSGFTTVPESSKTRDKFFGWSFASL